MKKFLTVLLVIAVMFTFSFGSAFAVAPQPEDQVTPEKAVKEITDAANAVKANLLKAKNDALYSIFGSAADDDIDGVTVAKTTVEKVYNDVLYDAAVEAVDAALAQKLQAVQTAMNPTGVNEKFSGYFSKTTAASETNASGVILTYPAYDKDFNAVAVTYKPTASTTTATDVVKDLTTASFTSLFENNSSAYASKVGQQSFKDAKEAALTAIRAIDITVYSKEYKGEAKSNYDLASELIAKAIEELNKLTVTDSTDWNASKALQASITDIYEAGTNQADPKGKLNEGGLLAAPYNTVGLNNLEKSADEPTAAAKLEWAKSKVLAGLTSDINTKLDAAVEAADKIILDETLKGTKGDATAIAKAKEDKENAQKQAAAAKEVATYLVANTKKLTDLITENKPFSSSTVLYGQGQKWNYATDTGLMTAPTTGSTYAATKLVDIVEHVAELKTEAEILKASVMIDGAEYVAIETALEDAIDDSYVKGLTTNTLGSSDAQMSVWDRQTALVGNVTDTDIKVNGRKYTTVENWIGVALTENNQTKFEQKFFDEARAAVKEAKDAIYAAKTVADADAAFLAGLEKFEAIKTVADKNTAQSTKEFTDLKNKYNNEIDAYVDYKVASLAGASITSDYSWTPNTMKGELKKNLAKAYSVEELTAAYTEAKAEVDNLKTKAALVESKKALDARIAALPATVTVADKEVVGTLKKDIADFNDYCDLIGNTAQKVVVFGAVTNAYDKIKGLEEDAIKEAIKAVGTVTLDDKAAIEALEAQLDAYVAYYAGEDADDATIAALKGVAYNGTTVGNLGDKLEAEKIKAFKVMVGKLPADGSDVEGIKAARAAFEELTRASKMALYRGSEYDKLLDLEKLVEATTGVETLKITAGSTAKKGSITVKWTVKGTGDRDGFQIWKSTKKNKGFKKAFTTTKTTYKNTKGLKKGTRYYFKVRAYQVVDGKNVYSDWSNKAIRIAK